MVFCDAKRPKDRCYHKGSCGLNGTVINATRNRKGTGLDSREMHEFFFHVEDIGHTKQPCKKSKTCLEILIGKALTFCRISCQFCLIICSKWTLLVIVASKGPNKLFNSVKNSNRTKQFWKRFLKFSQKTWKIQKPKKQRSELCDILKKRSWLSTFVVDCHPVWMILNWNGQIMICYGWLSAILDDVYQQKMIFNYSRWHSFAASDCCPS
jgi:hypothetical protein